MRRNIRVVIKAGVALFMSVLLIGVILLFREDPTDLGYVGVGTMAEQTQRGTAKGPLRRHPSNPRYFTDGSGKAIYLTGSHIWNNFQDIDPPYFTHDDANAPTNAAPTSQPSEFDYPGYLRFLVNENHNFMRLWTAEQGTWAPWTLRPLRFRPLPYLRSGPGDALDGELKFDLTRFDPQYFDRLRSRVIAAGEQGIYVSVMFFEGWSVEKKALPGNPWRGHPYHRDNNINGIDGDPNMDDEGTETQTLALPAITRLQEGYVSKTLDTLNDLDNVLWEISNESDPASKEWQYHMISYIQSYETGKGKRHPVGITSAQRENVVCSNADLFNSPADWMSPSFNSRDNYRTNPPVADGTKVILLDTDHLWGIGGGRDWVWKSFTRGLNPIFMDPLDGPNWEPSRRAMGHTLAYANRIQLSDMAPHGELASTGFCIANPGKEYLAYLPFETHRIESARFFHRFKRPIRNFRRLFGVKTTLDLSAGSGKFLVEWFNPSTGRASPGREIEGGTDVSFTAPFRGDAVLYVRQAPAG